MPVVVALQSFQHGGHRRAGEEFSVSENHAKKLNRAGLVELKRDPRKAVGENSSASPAAQVLMQTTANRSRRGGRRKKAEPSSSLTQAFE